jgi:hypothetical protein
MRKTTYIPVLLAMAAASAVADAGDPPSEVARLNYMEGPVSFRPGSVEDWTAASLNYPLTIGDHLWTDDGARAELHVGSNGIRMNSRTALAVLNLDDRTVQLSLTEGWVQIHLRYLANDETFEVDTPNAAMSLVAPGDYLIGADSEQGRTTAIVRGGEADITAAGSEFSLRPRESAGITITDTGAQELDSVPPSSAFEDWCRNRDFREDQAFSREARYVPREMIGAEDLGQYGVWREDAQYGWVWVPTGVPAGWAPYRYGHWAWVEPWGWTWIDDAPWGFAPFHYGRWAFVGAAWVWVPGRMMVAVRPVYAPALVAFVGGPRFGVAAWFPLGPGEVYRPAYAASEVYVRNVNIVHVTDIDAIGVTNVRYMNQSVAGAVSVVPHDAFVSARPVARAAIMVPHETIMRAEVVGTTAPIAPTRVSVLAGSGGVVNTPPARFVDCTVVARQTPPPAPVPFAAKEQALRANGGRPLDTAQMNAIRGSAPPARPMARAAAPARPAAAPIAERPANAEARPSDQPREQHSQPAAKKTEKKKTEKKTERQ